ncbi:MAG: flagellar biosynthesis protein FlhB [Armatimonadetes bacterium]|nr:flagellar biosynthesis protein FlhB [Armatimonadota bacterium]
MAESSQERTEEATPRRKQEARKKGQVAKSNDLVGAAVLLATLVALPSAISQIGAGLMKGTRSSLTNLPSEMDFRTLTGFFFDNLQPVLVGFAMLVGTTMLVGVGANIAQIGLRFTTEPITPTFNKINPLNGLQRMFSRQSLFEGAKATAKAFLFFYLAWGAISAHWDRIVGLSFSRPDHAMATVGGLARDIILRVGMAWFIVAAIDYFVQRKAHDKRLRMTKEEVKQEMKESETSPELRAAMAQRRRKLSKQRVNDAVKRASVVITNPTHFAVALEYDPDKQHAPVVVAKGQDFLALRIRELAGKEGVPIVPNPPLARAIYRECEVGDAIPRELFQPVAEVLAFVWKTVKSARKG